LALGAELKANYCILESGRAFVYRGFNDLKVPLCYDRFKRSVISALKKQKKLPDFIAHDLSPHFLSTRLARQLKDTLLPESRIIADTGLSLGQAVIGYVFGNSGKDRKN